MTSEVRGMVRFFRSNAWLGVVSVLTVFALTAALWAIRGLGQTNADRERDRVASDVSGCQRGNDNRQFQSDQIAAAIRAVAIEVGADPLEADSLVDAIRPVIEPRVTDCSTVIPGADPDVPDFPEDSP